MEAVNSKADVGFKISGTVHFIALGRNFNLDIDKSLEGVGAEDFFDFKPHQKEWVKDILKGIDSWTMPDANGDCAVIDDWRSIFALCGIRRSIAPLVELCELPPIVETSLSLLEKLRTGKSWGYRPNLPQLSWHPLLSLANEYSLEDSQCKALLKKISLKKMPVN